MKPSEQRWPAQQAPDDFADRVVQAGLSAARADFAEVDLPRPRASIDRLVFFRRPAVRWTLASAFAFVAIVVYIVRTQAQAEVQARVARAQIVAAQDEIQRRIREVDELKSKVSKLEAELTVRRKWEQLDSVSQKAMSGAARMSDGTPRPASSRPACQCQPGDPLCSCL